MNDYQRKRVSGLVGLARKVGVNPADIDIKVMQIQRAAATDADDGDNRRRLAYVRTATELTVYVTQIAEAHLPCRDSNSCGVCSVLRLALATVVAVARTEDSGA